MKLPRKIKKQIPKNTPYCYSIDVERNKKTPLIDGSYWIRTCKYYYSGVCKKLNCEIEDQIKSCGISKGY